MTLIIILAYLVGTFVLFAPLAFPIALFMAIYMWRKEYKRLGQVNQKPRR